MPAQGFLRAVFTATMVSALLSGCSGKPKIEAERLAGRSSVEISGTITNRTAVRTSAVPRSAKAGEYGVGGAAVGAGIWVQDPYLAAIAITAPVVVLATAAAGGAIGGAYGAATGISATPEQINAAVATLNRNFRPWTHGRAFETALTDAFAERLSAASRACVTSRAERRACRRDGQSGEVRVAALFQLDRALTGGDSGFIDLVSSVTLWAEPRGLIEPNCIRWVYRTRAGNLMELARDNGRALDRQVAALLPQMARELTYELLPRKGSLPVPPRERERNASGARRINEAEYRLIARTARGRRLIEQGYYVLDTEAEISGPRRLNAIEFEMMKGNARGRRLIEQGFYVLDEALEPGVPAPRRKGGLPAPEAMSGSWTRVSCDYAALVGLGGAATRRATGGMPAMAVPEQASGG